MELKDLVGKHFLSGVDTTTEEVKKWGDCYQDANVVRFVIDGKTYKATEDPDDGYRSYLSELIITEEEVSNKFPPQEVVGTIEDDSLKDIIKFIDAITGKVVLEIGTDNTDNYYPFCVMYWSPENLAINIGK